MPTTTQLPSFSSYGDYSSGNYGINALVFTDAQGRDFYYSYRTLVAFRTPDAGLVVRENNWGPTTGKHLNWIDGGGGAAMRRLSSADFEAAVAEALRDA